MAVSRAPKRQVKPEAKPEQHDEQAVLDVIQRGGSVKADKSTDTAISDPQKSVQLRLYQSMLNEIDALRTRRDHTRGKRPLSRHAWIVAAIEDKLEKDRPKKR